MKKTYKREIAGGMLTLWTLITIRLFFYIEPSALSNYEELYNGLTFVLVPSGLAVFGFHGIQQAMAKRMENGSRPRPVISDEPPEGFAQ